MSELWVWTVWERVEADEAARDANNVPGLVGYSVEANDGHIGDVDEATSDGAQSGFLIVDTGFWIFGKKRMIPAGFVSRVDTDERKVYLGCSKDDVKGAPDYDAEREDHRDEVGDYYAVSHVRGT